MTNLEKCNAGQEYSETRKNILRLFAIILVCCTMVFISCRPHKDILPTVQRIQERGVRLAAPLMTTPFTHSEIGVLMRKGQDDLLLFVNQMIRQMKADGSLERLKVKYGLSGNNTKRNNE